MNALPATTASATANRNHKRMIRNKHHQSHPAYSRKHPSVDNVVRLLGLIPGPVIRGSKFLSPALRSLSPHRNAPSSSKRKLDDDEDEDDNPEENPNHHNTYPRPSSSSSPMYSTAKRIKHSNSNQKSTATLAGTSSIPIPSPSGSASTGSSGTQNIINGSSSSSGLNDNNNNNNGTNNNSNNNNSHMMEIVTPSSSKANKSNGPDNGNMGSSTSANQPDTNGLVTTTTSLNTASNSSSSLLGLAFPNNDNSSFSASSTTAAAAAVAAPAAPTSTPAVTATTINSAPSTPALGSDRSLNVFQPIRRPRRGAESLNFRVMQETYFTHARAFKYSGEARYLSTYPASHMHYRPLRDPPPKGSPYHTHGGLMALLEVLEALLCFVYSEWCQDQSRHPPGGPDRWESLKGYLSWCHRRWIDHIGERNNVKEKAFIGLIHLIRAFYLQRITKYKMIPAMKEMTSQYQKEIEMKGQQQQQQQQLQSGQGQGPEMQQTGSGGQRGRMVNLPPEKSLPSPDTDAASANSTPAAANGSEGGSGSTSGVSGPVGSGGMDSLLRNGGIERGEITSTPHPYSHSHGPAGSSSSSGGGGGGGSGSGSTSVGGLSHSGNQHPSSSSSVTVSVPANYIHATQRLLNTHISVSTDLRTSERTLSLSIIREHFPHTFSRIIHSTLAVQEEWEGDMEDGEGELVWPGQCGTGEGVAWVCLIGRAMVREFGKGIGYLGLAGVIPKPGNGPGGGWGNERGSMHLGGRE